MNGSSRQTVTTGYGADGRINSAGFLHGGSEKQFAPLGRAGNGVPASQPTQPVATRPLAIQKDGTWFSAPARLAKQGFRSQVCSRLGGWLLKPHPAYGWDLTKNICEVCGPAGYMRTAYTYTPYGLVTASDGLDQPIQWSSEYNDTELGLVYYNYRHYNPADGRWIGWDKLNAPLLYIYIGSHICI